MIKAPFNFVPLNEKPYLADWADLISQDIPFEDGISGTIKLKIETKTPTFVGDEVKEDNTQTCEFCHVTDQNGRKQYFIPGTSIKGMIRNVMEILSFGKMTQVQNQSFGIRDLSNGADGRFYRAKVRVDNVYCGWLRYEGGAYVLKNCGIPWRISAEELDREFRMGLMNFITSGNNFQHDENRTAQKKYEIFRKAGRRNSDLSGYFMRDNTISITEGGRKFVRFDAGGKYGTVVFTGQPGERKKQNGKWSGKFFEFVFPEGGNEESVPENVFKAFESIHQNSPDYKDFRKKELRDGKEIPVFFTYNKEGRIDAIGISYMFKYPAFNSIYNAIPKDLLKHDGYDLCECIFGYTGKNGSLKGRVHFSHAMLTDANPNFCEDVHFSLAKPHPSYYPLYLGKGQTWNVENIRIAGRKRYPVRAASDIYPNAGTDAMNRIIRPMAEGSTFEGTIRFHNLRPVELGALLSAIDFCKHDECFHSIGQGKPLGYGKIKLSVTAENLKKIFDEKACSSQDARLAFETEMAEKFRGWAASPQLTELFAMAKGIEEGHGSYFQYMRMSTQRRENEFLQGLASYSEGEQLGTFTQILSGNVPRISQLGNVDSNIPREDIEAKLAEEQKKKEEEFARQQARREQLLAEQKEAERKNQEKKISEEIANQAYEAFNNKKYYEAQKLFHKAAKYGFDTYQAKIDECQMEIDNLKKQKGDISSFLANVKLASIKAFATQMKKRHEAATVTSADIPFIIQKIENNWNDLRPKDRRPWLERKSWSSVEKVLGTDITDAIYNGIKDLPIK